MSQQYVFSTYKLGKTHPPDKKVLRDISLSFLPGAKIGVLGLNGSGKSTLLRIMAGVERDFDGEARPADGISIGYLPQEPELESEAAEESTGAGTVRSIGHTKKEKVSSNARSGLKIGKRKTSKAELALKNDGDQATGRYKPVARIL